MRPASAAPIRGFTSRRDTEPPGKKAALPGSPTRRAGWWILKNPSEYYVHPSFAERGPHPPISATVLPRESSPSQRLSARRIPRPFHRWIQGTESCRAPSKRCRIKKGASPCGLAPSIEGLSIRCCRSYGRLIRSIRSRTPTWCRLNAALLTVAVTSSPLLR